MKKVIIVLAVLSPLVLSGCPEWGVDPIGNDMNTLVVHNQDEEQVDIKSVSVVLVPDECSNSTPAGINLLPEPIPYGGTFKIKNLADGRYYCSAYGHVPNSGYVDRKGYVTLAGGTETNWYVQ